MVMKSCPRGKKSSVSHLWQGVVLLLALAFLVGGCAGDLAQRKRQAESTRDMGERFLRQGQTSVALQQFLKALDEYPEDPYLHYDLGWAYTAKEAYDKAEFHLKEAIRLKPDYSEAYNYLGLLYFRRGQVDMAIESYKKALNNLLYLNPQNAHFNLGVAYISKNQYEKAVEHLESAIKLVPDYAVAYLELGKAYEGLHRDSEAKRAYKKAVEFAANNVEAQLNLGKLLYRTGESKEARKAFTEVMRLAPDSNEGREAQRYLSTLP
jgi:type IV pilus assembly protein PilF